MNSLITTLIIFGAAVLYSFFAGLFTRNYSHVDRLWSILPGVYVLVWLPDYIHNPRFIIPAIIILLWSIRLTTNFALKGGYNFSWKKGGFYEEDYRWAVLRKRIPNRFAFEVFNLFFISFYQLALVFAITLPLYFYGQVTGPITRTELILYCVHFLLLAGETIADIQQFRYYKMRSREEYKSDPRVSLGFNTFGLWKFLRHPNYVCEFGQWIVVYFYLHTAIGGWHLSGLGALLLVILFAGSTAMAEGITSSKYPAYADWKKATPAWFIFMLPFRMKARREFLGKYNVRESSQEDAVPADL